MTEWNKPYPPPPGWKGDEVDAAIGRAVSTAPSCSYDHYDAREIFSAGLATTDDPGRQFLVDELNRLTGENVTLRKRLADALELIDRLQLILAVESGCGTPEQLEKYSRLKPIG
jgi:hypothetical protein